MPWTFKDRVDDRGDNVVRRWLDEQPLKARLKIDQVLRNLRISDQIKSRFVKKLRGYDHVFEIVVEINKVQYRPLGGYGPHKGDFTIVLGAIEHNDNIRPRDAFTTAERHLRDLNNGLLRTCDHEYEKPDPTTP